MDQEYHNIYRSLFEIYQSQQVFFSRSEQVEGIRDISKNINAQLLGIIREAVEDNISEIEGRKLRPDARLFLTLNIHQMVALPVFIRLQEQNSLEEISTIIQDDIRRILQEAAYSAGDRDDVAASHVLWGTANVLDELRLKEWRLWERE